MNIVAWGKMSDEDVCTFCGSEEVTVYCNYEDEMAPVCNECIKTKEIERDLIGEVFDKIDTNSSYFRRLVELGEELLKKEKENK